MFIVGNFIAGAIFGVLLSAAILFCGYSWKLVIGDDEDNWKGNTPKKD